MDLGLKLGVPRRRGQSVAGGPLPDISGCFIWLRADLGITLDGNNVSQWIDRSRSGIIFEPGPYNPPNSEEITVNGVTFDTVKFTYTDTEALRSTNLEADLPTPEQDITQFNVFYCDNWDTNNSHHPILSWAGDHFSELFYLFRPMHSHAGARFEIYSGIYGANIHANGVIDPESKVQCFYGTRVESNSAVKMYTSGNGLMLESAVGGPHGWEWLSIGHTTTSANHWSNLNLAEVILYDSILSPGDMELVKTYIAGRYGIIFA